MIVRPITFPMHVLNDLSSGNYYDAFISFVDAAETTVEKAIKEGR